MPQRIEVVLSEPEREVLERWARRPKSAQALALRCRIVLAAAEGASSKEIAARLGCNRSTVGRWRGRFAERGLDGLHDEPRPGKPRSIGDAEVPDRKPDRAADLKLARRVASELAAAGWQLERVLTDNGGEFRSTDFRTPLDQLGCGTR